MSSADFNRGKNGRGGGNHSRSQGTQNWRDTASAGNDAYAPYNFVPLSHRVWFPKWGPLVSHDHPFADGLCGSLTINIHADTPLLVGGGASRRHFKQGDGTHIEFFETPDGKKAIPGSSLRGMLRNVVEIASFSRFSYVDNQRLAARDLTPPASEWFYNKRLTGIAANGSFYSSVHAGWLIEDEDAGGWAILPCKYARVEHTTLSPWMGRREVSVQERRDHNKAILGLSGEVWPEKLKVDGKFEVDRPEYLNGNKLKSSDEEYSKVNAYRKGQLAADIRRALGGKRPLEPTVADKLYCALAKGGLKYWFEPPEPKSRKGSKRQNKDTFYWQASVSSLRADRSKAPANAIPGHLVFTGFVENKHMEFVFHSPASRSIKVDDAVMEAFFAAHPEEGQKRGETTWGFWKRVWRKKFLSDDGPIKHLRLDRKRALGEDADACTLPGIPIFYLSPDEDGRRISSLGLAQLFKLGYEFSTRDMIAHTSPKHTAQHKIKDPDTNLDMAELLFGRVMDGGHSLKGRVSVGLGRLAGPQAPSTRRRRTVQGQPKPTYYPFYVEQDIEGADVRGDIVEGDYRTYRTGIDGRKPELRGWKRYLPRQEVAIQNIPEGATDRVISIQHPVLEGVTFRSEIKFHNLRPAELGVLVFAIRLAEQENARQRHLL